MLFKRVGFPEVDEFVYCVVTGVNPNSVFCRLDEFVDASGIIHISEVSPGRIRNIRDFVREGKVVICKVLRVNKERGYIDLSLRRVSDGQRRAKANFIKQEGKAYKILESVSRELKVPVKRLFGDVSPKVLDKYEGFFAFFMAFVEDISVLKGMKFSSDVERVFERVVCSRLQPSKVVVSGFLSLVSFGSDGVGVIRSALGKCVDLGGVVLYVSAGKYRVSVEGSDYKSAEEVLDRASVGAIGVVEASGGQGSFERV